MNSIWIIERIKRSPCSSRAPAQSLLSTKGRSLNGKADIHTSTVDPHFHTEGSGARGRVGLDPQVIIWFQGTPLSLVLHCAVLLPVLLPHGLQGGSKGHLEEPCLGALLEASPFCSNLLPATLLVAP